MKFEFNESDFSYAIDMFPETVEEAAQLLRFATSRKKEPPQVATRFGNTLYTALWFKRRKDNNEIKSVGD